MCSACTSTDCKESAVGCADLPEVRRSASAEEEVEEEEEEEEDEESAAA